MVLPPCLAASDGSADAGDEATIRAVYRDAAWAALRGDPAARGEELKERRVLDATLADGLDLSEVWHEDGTVEFVEALGDAHDAGTR